MRLGILWLSFAGLLLLVAASLAVASGGEVVSVVLRACLLAAAVAGAVGLAWLALGWKAGER